MNDLYGLAARIGNADFYELGQLPPREEMHGQSPDREEGR